MPEQKPRALIADGDQATRHVISRHLLAEGFDIGECGDGREALDQLSASRFDLIVLDGALEGIDGIALCRAIRQGSANPKSGLFIVATSSEESDKVLALVNGADDYLTKPFSMREFLARVSAIMRRSKRVADPKPNTPVDRPDLRIDPSRRLVLVRGSAVACSKQEFDLLYALASAPGIIFTREELVARYWRGVPNAPIRLVDPIISRLRRKVERNPDVPRMILTVWGIGYKFAE